MSRLYLDGQFFEQVSGASQYEIEYERLILAHADALFPEYHVIEFKPIIQSETGSAKPDLALVDRDLRLWWVVEVEMARHSLTGHVLPQVEVLTAGRYGLAEADILCHAIPSLDASLASDLVKGAQPGILVIANERRDVWEKELHKLGVSLMIIEVFRSDHNAHALRLSGAYPATPPGFVSQCRLDPLIPGLLVVEAPANLQIALGQDLRIQVEGHVTQWVRYDVQDMVWLKPCGPNPLEGKRGPFKLIRTDTDRLILDE